MFQSKTNFENERYTGPFSTSINQGSIGLRHRINLNQSDSVIFVFFLIFKSEILTKSIQVLKGIVNLIRIIIITMNVNFLFLVIQNNSWHHFKCCIRTSAINAAPHILNLKLKSFNIILHVPLTRQSVHNPHIPYYTVKIAAIYLTS